MIHRESGREKEREQIQSGRDTDKEEEEKKKKNRAGERWALPGTSEKSKSIWKSSYCFWREPMFFCYFQVCGERKLTPTCQAMNPPDSSGDTGDSGSIPGLGRYPGVGNGNLLHYSCLENSMDRGAWWALVLGIPKSWSQLSIHTQKWNEHLKRQSLCRRGTRDTLSTYLPHTDKYREDV